MINYLGMFSVFSGEDLNHTQKILKNVGLVAFVVATLCFIILRVTHSETYTNVWNTLSALAVVFGWLIALICSLWSGLYALGKSQQVGFAGAVKHAFKMVFLILFLPAILMTIILTFIAYRA